MSRSREQIMAEWDAIRVNIATGCAHSGPRDWFEGVLDETDERIAELEALLRRIDAVTTWETTPLGRHFQDELDAALRR